MTTKSPKNADFGDESGYHANAIPFFEKALRLAPGNDLLLLSLGVSYAEKGRFDTALSILRKATELYPKNERINRNYDAIKQAAK